MFDVNLDRQARRSTSDVRAAVGIHHFTQPARSRAEPRHAIQLAPASTISVGPGHSARADSWHTMSPVNTRRPHSAACAFRVDSRRRHEASRCARGPVGPGRSPSRSRARQSGASGGSPGSARISLAIAGSATAPERRISPPQPANSMMPDERRFLGAMGSVRRRRRHPHRKRRRARSSSGNGSAAGHVHRRSRAR